MKQLLAFIGAFTIGAAFAAEDIYVAREDENASDVPCEGRGTQALPYLTIQAAIAAAPAGANVWVGRGVYADEPTVSDDIPARVVIGKSLKLESLEGRDVTHIVGAKAATETGIGAGAVRGIHMTVKDVTVKGFTIRDCAVSDESKNGGGVCMLNATPSNDYLVDCVVSNCAAKCGGAVSLGTVAGCWFSRNVSLNSGSATSQCRHLNCLVTGNVDLGKRDSGSLGYALKYPGAMVNCTIAGNYGDCVFHLNSGTSYALYNCLFADNSDSRVGSKSAAVTNCAFKSDITACGDRFACKEDLMDCAFVSPMTDDWRPMTAAGVSEVGDAQWLAMVALPNEDYRYIDAMGNAVPRTGAIFAGAIQQAAEPACGALVFSEIFGGEGLVEAATAKAAYVRPSVYPSMLKVRAAQANETNLVYYTYGTTIRPPRRDGSVCIIPPPTGSATLTPKYATTVVYADADNGNDSWDGSAAVHIEETDIGPKKTLQAAVDATPAGTGGTSGKESNAKWSLVIAAKGTYDRGGMVASSLALSNRVCVTANRRVRIFAEEGPEKTLIVGAPDPETQGFGPNAMRCVALEVASVVQGFTLTGGYTDDSADETNATRAGGISGASSSDCVAADCVISNNFAGHGAGIRYARAYRCRIWGNSTSRGHGSTRTASLVSSLLGDQRGGVDTLVGVSSACYNTTIVGKANSVSGSTTFYDVLIKSPTASYAVTAAGCYSEKGFGSGATDSPTGPVEFADAANGDFRLPADSSAFGKGNATMEQIYTVACEDLEGNLMKFVDGATVPGAFQRPADVLNLTVNVPAGGQVTVSGGEAGRNILKDGATVTVVHDAACGRNCLGFEVDGTFVASPSYTYVSPDRGAVSNCTVTAVYSTDWYVNPDESVGDDLNDGFTPGTAKRTLKGVMSAAVVAGDTVHAARGVYRKETMKQTGICASSGTLADVTIMNRVAVPQGVTLCADEGPDETAIEGKLATDGDQYGLGADAERCVFLDHGATLRGFTIRNGRTRSEDGTVDDAYAGGILGLDKSDCTVEDCVITNCVGQRGGAGHSLTFRRCRIFDNTALKRGAVSRLSAFYGCVIDRNTGSLPEDYYYVISNCTFGAESRIDQPNGAGWICDSIIQGTLVNAVTGGLRRCAYLTTSHAVEVPGCLRVGADDLALDGTYAPIFGSNVAIDRIPLADEPAAANEVDCYGRQRVYNGARDWGAVDADWRGVYARALGRGLTVETASPYAVTNEAGHVFLPKGGLTVAWGREGAPETTHRLQAHVTGTGVLSATLNNAAEPFATVTQGDPVELSQKVAGRNTFAFDYAPGQDDDGGAELFGFKRDIGLLLLVR